jgi:penicillin amidase
MPGTDSSYDWQGIIPSNENPMIVNPAIGFVSSANQMPTDSTYPYYLGASSNFPLYRGIIINRKLAAMNGITAKDMQQMQNDNYNVFAEMARPVLLKYINEKLLNKNELRYITILKKWNLKQDIAEQGATVFNAIWDSLSQEIFQDDFQKAKQPISWPEDATLLQSLLKDSAYSYADNISTRNKVETIQENIHLAVKKAAAHLQQLEKIATINWADIKDTRISHVLKLPALSRLHLTIGGGKNCINATTDMHGPSWRMIVHLTDEMEAYGVYPGGQNGNPGSRFYDNFIDSWVAGNYYRLLFLSKPAAEKNEKIKWHITFNHG